MGVTNNMVVVCNIWDILSIVFWVLVISVIILACIVDAIKGKFRNIFRKNKINEESEVKDEKNNF